MADNTRFRKLLEPGQIGAVKTRNRLIKTGAGTFMAHQDEMHMSEAMKAFYESLARGGVGLLIVESPIIDYPTGARWPQRYRIDDDKYIGGLSELVQVIHKYGCPTFMQMNHDGPWQRQLLGARAPFFEGQPVAASAVSMKWFNDFHNEVPHELTIAEIEEKIDKFASAAVRARKAGFDGVDLNCGSSHLLHNFLSPFWNRRQDIYGGNPENRARIVTSIIREIKKRLGRDFPVTVCINGLEVGQIVGVDDNACITPEYSRQIGKILEAAGADAIQVRNHWMGYHVGGYLPDVLFWPDPPIPRRAFNKEYNTSRHGIGANIYFASGMKRAVSIPVITVGRLDPELGERVLRQGQADFIAMTRRLQADPDLPRKVAEGRLENIAPCTGCESCLGSRRCRINPFMGSEHNSVSKASKKKKVVVVGGGPAGMEAARTAALRGHEVTLYEKQYKLGGLLPVAAIVKGTSLEDLPAIVRYLERQITSLGVKVVKGIEFTPALIENSTPDTVILAVGGVPVLPRIKGIDNRKVVSPSRLHRDLKVYSRFFGPNTLRWLTRFWMPISKKVVIIGGGIQGCELAEFLTRRGRQVTIVDKEDTMGKGMVGVLLDHLMLWFEKKGVRLVNGVKEYVEITDKGLTIINREGELESLKADSIIPALPLQPNLELLKKLEGRGPEVYAVGDCREPLLIVDAIGTGARTVWDV
jgi:2,4-dienoyl-CoA reductase (NADPH2)